MFPKWFFALLVAVSVVHVVRVGFSFAYPPPLVIVNTTKPQSTSLPLPALPLPAVPRTANISKTIAARHVMARRKALNRTALMKSMTVTTRGNPAGADPFVGTMPRPERIAMFRAAKVWMDQHANAYTTSAWRDLPNASVIEADMLRRFRNLSVVYTWINTSDPADQALRRLGWKRMASADLCREDLQLRYSVRSFEKFLSWHTGQVFLVTPGYWPTWVNRSHPRLTLINQSTLVPERTRPFFNSNLLELHLDRIPGLTDHFIHLNDDYLFLRNVTPAQFLLPDGGVNLFMGPGLVDWSTTSLGNASRRLIWRSATANSWDKAEQRYGTMARLILKHSPFVYHKRVFPLIREYWASDVSAVLSHQYRHHQDVIAPILHHAIVINDGDKLGLPGKIPSMHDLFDQRYLSYSMEPSKLAPALEALHARPRNWLVTVNGKCQQAATRDVFYAWLEHQYPDRCSVELR